MEEPVEHKPVAVAVEDLADNSLAVEDLADNNLAVEDPVVGNLAVEDPVDSNPVETYMLLLYYSGE